MLGPTDAGFCHHFVNYRLTQLPDGNYEWPGNDHCFVQCVHGKPYCQCCHPKRLFFNEKCNQCMYKKNQGKTFNINTLKVLRCTDCN